MKIWHYNEIVATCLAMQPKQGRGKINGQRRKHCVTEVICAVQMEDGRVIRFDESEPMRAGYVRVSCVQSRSSHMQDQVTEKDTTEDQRPKSPKDADGWGEDVQIKKLLDYCISTPNRNGKLPCLIIYSDAGLSGRLTTDDPNLTREVAEAHANLYHEIFTIVMLDPNLAHTPTQRANMEAYRDNTVALIREGYNDAERSASIERIRKRRAGMPSRHFRPGLSELVIDLKKTKVTIGEILFTDLTRLARNMIFLQMLFKQSQNKRVQLVGLIQKIGTDGADAATLDLLIAFFGWMGQMRIREITIGYWSGVLSLLRSGLPMAGVPFYITTHKSQPPTYNSAHVDIMLHIIETFLDITEKEPTDGIATLARLLDAEGIPTPTLLGKGRGARVRTGWSPKVLRTLLSSPALVGRQLLFGRLWDTLTPIIDENKYALIHLRLAGRKNANDPRNKHDWDDRQSSNLFYCYCNGLMTHGNNYLQCGHTKGKETHTPGHPRPYLRPANVNAFLDAYVSSSADALLQPLRISAQRIGLEQERANALRHQIDLQKKIEVAQAEIAPKIARAMEAAGVDADTDTIQNNAKQHKSLKPLTEALSQILGEVTRLDTMLSSMVSADEIGEIEERVSNWGTLTERQKNVVLRRIFERFLVVENGGGLAVVPVMADGQQLLPVPITEKRWGAARMRALPETEDELTAYFAGNLMP